MAMTVHRACPSWSSSIVESKIPFSKPSQSGKCAAFRVRACVNQTGVVEGSGRRQILLGMSSFAATVFALGNHNAFAKAPSGYQAVLDSFDKYQFVYPFGWQEVSVKGQDCVYKDVIEPLESVSVNIIETSKADLKELGSAEELPRNRFLPHKIVSETSHSFEGQDILVWWTLFRYEVFWSQVATTLVGKVLTSASQKAQLLEAKERVTEGKTYYTFEFVSKAPNYTRHALSTVTVSDGKFYTLTTGANERRWGKMQEKLRTVADSFSILQ